MTPLMLPARLGHLVVTGTLVLFAVWTLVYQAALLLGIPSTPTLLLAALIGGVVLLVLRPRPSRGTPVTGPLPAAATSLTVLVVTIVATGLALVGERTPALLLGLGTAVAALALTWRASSPHPDTGRPEQPDRAEHTDTDTEDDPGAGRWLWPVGWLAALVSAGLASIIVHPDGDDAYFVNLSTWVAERGAFPLRDTMISPDVFPALGVHSPPTHSIEALIGALARVVGIEAGTAAYVLVTPGVVVVAVLALTLLIEEARIPTAPAALVGMMGYLWTAGASGYSIGSFFGPRMWQGKAMLVSLALPLVLLTGARLVRRGSLRNHVLFGSALVAAVGVSNTAAFLAPVLVAGLVLAAFALRRPRAAVRLAVWVAYPLAAGVVSVLLAPPGPTLAQRRTEGFTVSSGATSISDPLLTVPGKNGLLLITCLAIGLGALGIRDLVLRTATISAVLVGGIPLLPGVRDVMAGIGLGSVVWRFWWVVPLHLLLAGTVGALAGRLPVPGRVAVAGLVAGCIGLLPLVNGQWVGSSRSGSRVATPLTWKVPAGALREAQFVESISAPGDTVLAPWDTSRVLSALTVDVQPVSARRFYLPSYAGTRSAHAGAREVLQRFADTSTPKTNTIAEPLDLLSVDTACVGTSRGAAIDLLETNGFTEVGSKGSITCLRR